MPPPSSACDTTGSYKLQFAITQGLSYTGTVSYSDSSAHFVNHSANFVASVANNYIAVVPLTLYTPLNISVSGCASTLRGAALPTGGIATL